MKGINTVVNDENTNLAVGDLINIESLVLTGDAAVEGRGNELNNIITGNGADNDLYGALGEDTLSGGAGADRALRRWRQRQDVRWRGG